MLVGRFGLSFLVVTLGTLILFRGFVNLWSGTKTEQVLSSLLDSSTIDVPYDSRRASCIVAC